MIFDLFDISCAKALKVPVKYFVTTIEKTSDLRMEVIISACLSNNPVKIAKAKRCFDLINK